MFVTNSQVVALYKELRRVETPGETVDPWAPKAMTEEQMAELNKFNAGKVSVIVCLYVCDLMWLELFYFNCMFLLWLKPIQRLSSAM